MPAAFDPTLLLTLATVIPWFPLLGAVLGIGVGLLLLFIFYTHRRPK